MEGKIMETRWAFPYNFYMENFKNTEVAGNLPQFFHFKYFFQTMTHLIERVLIFFKNKQTWNETSLCFGVKKASFFLIGLLPSVCLESSGTVELQNSC